MLYHCYRNRCTIVTENDVLLILMYSILPKMMYFSLPITAISSVMCATETRGMSQGICGRCSVPGTGTKLWSKRGANGSSSAPSGAGITGASASGARMLPAWRIILT